MTFSFTFWGSAYRQLAERERFRDQIQAPSSASTGFFFEVRLNSFKTSELDIDLESESDMVSDEQSDEEVKEKDCQFGSRRRTRSTQRIRRRLPARFPKAVGDQRESKRKEVNSQGLKEKD